VFLAVPSSSFTGSGSSLQLAVIEHRKEESKKNEWLQT
jgi:hypothetical protein